MTPDLAKTADHYLSNYLGDLEYWIDTCADVNGVNFHTAVTPCFDSLLEARQYAAEIKRFIETLKESES